MVSSLAVTRSRETVFNSWDKNGPKDAEVILSLMKQGLTQVYHDLLVYRSHDIQELAKTYQQTSLARKRRILPVLLTVVLTSLPVRPFIPAVRIQLLFCK